MIANKLVESWLDNQSERQYQPAFVQLLISEGWDVLHNTRHTALEFGKDVIARAPDGTLYAIQLKGNPGTRVSKSEAQSLLGQFREGMISFVPDAYQATKNERHVFVFCTNGEIDEAAMVLFENVAKHCGEPGVAASKVEYWSRGNLLNRFTPQIEKVWPSSPEAMSRVLKVYTHEGRDLPDIQLISASIEEAMKDPYKMTASRKRAIITASLLFSEILKRPWRESEDHYSMFLISVLAAVRCIPLADRDDGTVLIAEYLEVAAEHANSLISEAIELGYDPKLTWAQRNPLAEVDIMIERRRLIADAGAFLVLFGVELSPEKRTYLRELLEYSFDPNTLWGQAVIPSMIVRYWAYRKLDATCKPDLALISVLRAVISAARRRDSALAANSPPYYRFDEVLYLTSGGIVGDKSDISRDIALNRSYFAKALFLMVAKRNWKQTCKNLWRVYSNLLHESVRVPDNDFFSPQHSKEGENSGQQIFDSTWLEQIEEAVRLSDWSLAKAFEPFPALLAAYLTIVPYRAQPWVIMHLDEQLADTWYGRHHFPPRS
ncbi:hypothetical protein [Pelagerythrobacter marinus]|uniref:hypothetical protein n=1 Tax=Pelagerythrobacter marinus TaxID=538382 RepID=UPI00203746B9|nr:hypothetical protein [Pelagerythrobacter marinus]USA40929.1 hypothetical protein NCF86_07255 [Pelagerythrobacter marinus]WPZ07897.1 hypothetical protein T8T98_05095 [Pelagerythrobacter marinus]